MLRYALIHQRGALVFRSARGKNARVPKFHPLHFAFQITIVYPDAEDGAHRGLDDFRVVDFYRILRGEYRMDAEPVGDAQDGTQVAGVADAVKGEDEFVGLDADREGCARLVLS